MRKHLILGIGLLLFLASCGSEVASTSTTPPSQANLPVLSPAATPSSEPEPLVPPIEVGDYLEVTGNGLAVRSGPGLEHPLVSEYLLGTSEPLATTLVRSEVRLPVGHVVRVELGPLLVDDTTWFAVVNVPQAGQAQSDTPIWRTVAPVPYSEIDFELTWIAAAQAGSSFVRVTERPACSACYEEPLLPTAVAAGLGGGRVGPWINRDAAWMTVAAAARSSGSTCEFHVANQAGEPMFFDEFAVDYLKGLIPGVSPAPDAGPLAEVWLDISGDCTWAVTVYVAQG